MEALTLPIYNTEGKETGRFKLDEQVFDGTVNTAAMYQAVTAYRANQRKGLASTKTMGEVSGGGRKPWKQKGTGRARVGSIRSPLWRHGGVVFGPHPRDYSYSIPRKIMLVALKSAICAKIKEENLTVLEDFSLDKPRAKDAAKIFSNLKINLKKNNRHRILLLLDKVNVNHKLGLRNINLLQFKLAKETNVYEVLSAYRLVITREGLEDLTERLKKQ